MAQFIYPLDARLIRLIAHRSALRLSHTTLTSQWLPEHVFPPPAPQPRLNIGYISSDYSCVWLAPIRSFHLTSTCLLQRPSNSTFNAIGLRAPQSRTLPYIRIRYIRIRRIYLSQENCFRYGVLSGRIHLVNSGNRRTNNTRRDSYM